MANLNEKESLEKLSRLYTRWYAVFAYGAMVIFAIGFFLTAWMGVERQSICVALLVGGLSATIFMACISILLIKRRNKFELARAQLADQEFAERKKLRQVEHEGPIQEVSRDDDDGGTTVVKYTDGYESDLGRYPLSISPGTPLNVKVRVVRDGNGNPGEVWVYTEKFRIILDDNGTIREVS